jgi:hypothetical protein
LVREIRSAKVHHAIAGLMSVQAGGMCVSARRGQLSVIGH